MLKEGLMCGWQVIIANLTGEEARKNLNMPRAEFPPTGFFT